MATESLPTVAEDKREHSKADMDEDPVAPMIAQSLDAFRRDLPQLLQTHYRQWVAYHGDTRIGFARNGSKLYDTCLRRGLKRDEFLVCFVAPEIPDEDITWT
jgi:hypothetical protein